MRNIEASPWLGSPELIEIKLVPAPGTAKDRNLTINEFIMTFQVKRAAATEARLAPTPGAPPPKGAPPAPTPTQAAAAKTKA
jgi:hypothetical protein